MRRLLGLGAPAWGGAGCAAGDDGRGLAPGSAPLAAAAAGGHAEAAAALLEAGAPWNALDAEGVSAGERALLAGHVEVAGAVMEAGVRAELILGALQRGGAAGGSAITREGRARRAAAGSSGSGSGAAAAVSADGSGSGSDCGDGGDGGGSNNGNSDSATYLGRSVRYEGEKLLDSAEDAVMMEWERPLMGVHADALCPDGTAPHDVLNVGFGMGIVDGFLQAKGVRSHTILEAHPGVLAEMESTGWPDKPGVRVIRGRWQETISQIPDASLSAVFFDTYGEYDSDMREFHAHLPRILRPGGRYSFFNGLCPDNLFFQNVACQVVALELQALGLSCDFVEVTLEAPDEDTWKGVARPYFHSSTYYLPMATFAGDDNGRED